MKILVAEDDPVSNRLIQKILTRLRHEVLPAENGLQAWEIYQENEIRMVVTDWIMPEMDGLTLCKKIRSSDKEEYSYIIVLTAKDQQRDLIEVFDVGADDYIIKPFDPEELRARVNNGERIIKLENGYKDLQGILIESRNKLRIVFDSLKEEIFAVDNGFRIVSANKTLLNNLGISFSELIDKPCFQDNKALHFPYEIKEVKSAATKVFETGASQFLSRTFSDRQGDQRHREIDLLPVKSETGKVLQVVIVARDITREREKSEEIRRLNERLQEALNQVEAKNEKLEEILKGLSDTQVQVLQSEKMP